MSNKMLKYNSRTNRDDSLVSALYKTAKDAVVLAAFAALPFTTGCQTLEGGSSLKEFEYDGLPVIVRANVDYKPGDGVQRNIVIERPLPDQNGNWRKYLFFVDGEGAVTRALYVEEGREPIEDSFDTPMGKEVQKAGKGLHAIVNGNHLDSIEEIGTFVDTSALGIATDPTYLRELKNLRKPTPPPLP